MTVNLSDLYAAILARLNASNNSTFRGVWAMRAPPNQGPGVGLLPTVVFSCSWEGDDTFESDGRSVQVLVTITDHIDNTTAPTFAAYSRIRGNAAPPNTAPTYGLHRHILTLTGDNEPGVLVETGGDELYDQDHSAIGLVIRYTVNHDIA